MTRERIGKVRQPLPAPVVRASPIGGCVGAGSPVIVIGEEWKTSWSVVEIPPRQGARMVAMGALFVERRPHVRIRPCALEGTARQRDRHDRSALHEAYEWQFGVDPVVIPNAIATEWLDPCDPAASRSIRSMAPGRLVLARVARWDPDKRSIMALEAVAELKQSGIRPLLVARGGGEPHGQEVLTRATALGLSSAWRACSDGSQEALRAALVPVANFDIVLVRSSFSRPQLQLSPCGFPSARTR